MGTQMAASLMTLLLFKASASSEKCGFRILYSISSSKEEFMQVKIKVFVTKSIVTSFTLTLSFMKLKYGGGYQVSFVLFLFES